MNLIEKLKNVPGGTTMYSPLFKDPITFVRIDKGALYPIICKTIVGELFELTQEGYCTVATSPQNCMLFPTPEMTWEGYSYFEDGSYYAGINNDCLICVKGGFYRILFVKYYWGINTVTGTKVTGKDTCIGHKVNPLEYQKALENLGYTTFGKNLYRTFPKYLPFQEVLVRDSDKEKWKTAYYSHKEGPIHIANGHWVQCIPYAEETKHLVGTTKEAPRKYITWDRV